MNKKVRIPEQLEYAVYGGICGMIGLVSIIVLLIAVFECKPALVNAILISFVNVSFAVLTIHFGMKSNIKEGRSVIIFGAVILLLVVLTYIFGIIPCIMQ